MPAYPAEADPDRLAELLDKEWSPSSLDTFFTCPRHFYLKEICLLPEEEADDPFTVLNAAGTGTVAHALMERLGQEQLSKEDFLKLAGAAFEREMKLRPPIRPDEARHEKQTFLEMMAKAYDKEPASVQVVSAENEYKGLHPSGIRVHGFPDRIEQQPDGTNVIVDYKTGRSVKHKPNDPETCLQILVYAWLCEESAGLAISHGEYRYLRLGETVRCEYDAVRKDALAQKLTVFRETLERGGFERNPGKNRENCRYCAFAHICDWEQPIEKEDAGDDD